GSLAEGEFAAFGEDPNDRVRAAKLDESLEIIAGLWSGDEFSFAGAHFRVDPVRFRPVPVQRPRPPLWIAGSWPNRRPLERAARWDGLFATHRDVGHDETMSPQDLERIVRHTNAHREGDDPFDIVIEGLTADASRAARLQPYADVGLTWWIEKLGWFRGTVREMRERIHRGPPLSD
ncbi:MAG: LLM class flavin-dependent oxidoreductase, partial [Actinomycetota bacterium]